MMQNDGAGIEMALSVGAATYNIDMPPMSHFVAPYVITTSFDDPMDNDIPYGMVCSGEVMAVDQTGSRFLAENGIAMNAYTNGARYYTIFSAEQIDILREQGFSMAASGRYLSQGGVPADTPLDQHRRRSGRRYFPRVHLQGGFAGRSGRSNRQREDGCC